MQSTDTLVYHCPHCGVLMDVPANLADRMVTCAKCRRPFRAEAPSSLPVGKSRVPSDRPVAAASVNDEQVLRTVHPAMFRNHPFLYLCVLTLLLVALAGIVLSLSDAWGMALGNWLPDAGRMPDQQPLLGGSGALAIFSIVFLFAWWVHTRLDSLQITTERSILQSGLVARSTSEVRHADVRNLQIHQTVLQRLFGVGTLAISSAGQDDFEIVAKGIPSPEALAEVIRQYEQ
jgi:hypothetical protein